MMTTAIGGSNTLPDAVLAGTSTERPTQAPIHVGRSMTASEWGSGLSWKTRVPPRYLSTHAALLALTRDVWLVDALVDDGVDDVPGEASVRELSELYTEVVRQLAGHLRNDDDQVLGPAPAVLLHVRRELAQVGLIEVAGFADLFILLEGFLSEHRHAYRLRAVRAWSTVSPCSSFSHISSGSGANSRQSSVKSSRNYHVRSLTLHTGAGHWMFSLSFATSHTCAPLPLQYLLHLSADVPRLCMRGHRITWYWQDKKLLIMQGAIQSTQRSHSA